jgi:CDP-6-deoxy-D-xylo-4-hexulose-3-dehydrase
MFKLLGSKKNILKSLLKSKKKNKINSYPLLQDGYSDEDLIKGIEVLLSGQITMSELTKKFENEFAEYIGSKYAVMTNSGSSANLLASFTLINPKKKNHLKTGNNFLIPALCWPTSLWPLVQCGLNPIFTDVNINNFCIDEDYLTKNLLNKIKVIVVIHVLGNSPNINSIAKIAKKKNIYLIEDTCEALGSKYNSRHLGTFGDFGTYSFYYSHQITSGEGGMVVCNSKEDYEILISLRAHGWDRELKNKNNKSFNFINSGFNVRPTDIAAAIGLNQFKRLNHLKKIRHFNRELIINSLKKSQQWNFNYDFFLENKNTEASWFGLPLMINKSQAWKKKKFMEYLNKNGVETRPIISGNFFNQPVIKLYKFDSQNNKFKNSQEIEDRGFFIGLPSKKIEKRTLDYLVNKLLYINQI